MLVFKKLKILPVEHLSSMRVLQLDPETMKGAKIGLFMEDPCVSLAQ